jgi:hypothetical protein
MPGRPHEGAQTAALVRAFLARFFENEITAGTSDLKTSFFWLLGILMALGLFIPLQMMWSWDLIVRIRGPEFLRVVSRGDKALYLGFTMVATGVISAIAWSSLLTDRRDALILGALPVRPAVVVRAKLGALALYVLLIAVAMHALASLAFGTLLASRQPFEFLARSITAHFVVSCAAGAFVVLSVAGIQGLALTLTGPRVFSRIAPVLQVGLVGLIVLGLLLLPALNVSVVDTLREAGRNPRPWLLQTPPLWFLGAYEWVLGTDDPKLLALARTALLAVLVPAVVTLVTYPLAYRRLMASAVEWDGSLVRTRRAAVAEGLARIVGRDPGVRAAAQFFLSSAGRLERHRFAIATSLGVAAAWSLPTIVALVRDAPDEPATTLLSLPIAVMIFVLVGLRTAAALPADPGAGWLFDLHRPSRRHVHAALERTMLLLGVLPLVCGGVAMCGLLWGARVAVLHGLLLVGTGALLVQMLLWLSDAMPCGRRWEAGRLDLGRRWWLYVAVFLVFTAGLPALGRALLGNTIASVSLSVALIMAAAAVRYVSLRLPPRTGAEDGDDGKAVVLQLNA